MENNKRKRSSSPRDIKSKNTRSGKSADKKVSVKNVNYKEKKHVPKKPKTFVKKLEAIEKSDDDFFTQSVNQGGKNFVKVFSHLQEHGFYKLAALQHIAEQIYSSDLRWFSPFQESEMEDLRVTAMQWHPNIPHFFVVGGKAGTLQLYNTRCDSHNLVKTFQGIGPGGTMEAIRFNTKRSGLEVCTASIDGSVSAYNFDSEHIDKLVISENPDRVWFCAVDIHQDGKSVYGGNSAGKIAIHHLDSSETTYVKLHASKIKHLEFSQRDPTLMVTSSLDKTVKLWDIRKLGGPKDSLVTLKHECGVSAASFSRTDGCRLLTTDQNNELRVYKAPFWSLEHTIKHPHRKFHHLTDIKATWHPLADIFVIGRYPDPKLPDFDAKMRSVDVFSAYSGRLFHELMDSSRLISSLCQFNITGQLMATSSGRTIHIWLSWKTYYKEDVRKRKAHNPSLP